MAVCTVTLTSNTAAVSGAVEFEPYPNQLIDNVAIDCGRVTASISGNDYSAALIRKAKYRIISPMFSFHNKSFIVPDSASVNLAALLQGFRSG